jgi:hypothetical protein
LALLGPDRAIGAALRLRLPIPQLQDMGVCACTEAVPLDPHAPLHALRCRTAFTSGGVSAMIHQHATVRDTLAGVLSASGLGGGVVREDRTFFAGVTPAGTSRTACVPDITYTDRTTCLRACVDTMITSAHPTHDDSAATVVLAAASRGE